MARNCASLIVKGAVKLITSPCSPSGRRMKPRCSMALIMRKASSVAGEMGCAYGSIYAVAKAAIIHYTRCLAAQLRPHGVNVNCISPGAIRTARFLATRTVSPERGGMLSIGHL